MTHDRSRASRGPMAALAALLLVSLTLLSGCGFTERLDATRGFEYATDHVNTLSNGVSDRSATVNVIGAVVIAGEDNVGAFAATLINTDENAPVKLTGLRGDATAGTLVPDTAPDFTVPAAGYVNMFRTGAITVSGSFSAGEFVNVELTLDTGEVVPMTVPVVKPCYHYAPEELGFELPTAAVAETPTAGETPSASPPPAAPTTEDAEAAADNADLYSCLDTSPELGGGATEEH